LSILWQRLFTSLYQPLRTLDTGSLVGGAVSRSCRSAWRRVVFFLEVVNLFAILVKAKPDYSVFDAEVDAH